MLAPPVIPWLRLATHADLAAVMDLLTAQHAEIGLAPMSVSKVERRVQAIIEQCNLVVADADGVLAGALGIVEGELWYSETRALSDQFWYVKPEFRSTTVGNKLLMVLRERAKEAGLLSFVTILNPDRAGKRGVVAEILGYVPAGYKIRLT